jgi:hypothetical protein
MAASSKYGKINQVVLRATSKKEGISFTFYNIESFKVGRVS